MSISGSCLAVGLVRGLTWLTLGGFAVKLVLARCDVSEVVH